ncbi:periplasmic nitrate reductase, NapE protein [Lysobacter sp. TAF61]|uniref:periplasmic nitrate reductase, NapE protein n=1 Tax=Lysobacter sp. TAF61 TaxID=3233072 RepID=UPI003F99DD1C
MGQPDDTVIRRRERIAFLLLTAVVFPLLTVMFVGGYGFVVWIWQMFAGPPSGH